MGTHKNVIRLNGKVYDAKTGKQVSMQPARQGKQGHHATARTGVSVDGFFGGHKKPVSSRPTKAAVKPAQPKPTRAPKHTLHHKQQRSKTLMRSAVSKPSMPMPKAEPKKHTVEPEANIANDKIKRALAIPKSSLITKFSNSTHRGIQTQTRPLPVKKAPAGKVTKSSVTMPHATQSVPAQTSAETHFRNAISKSHSHEQSKPRVKKRSNLARRFGISRKALNASAGALAVVLLFGFFAYQNVPNFSMQIAAARAGFDAKMPSYKPSGFALGGPIQYGPGHITVNFSSNSDDRNFSVSEQVSSWNSEALADNYLTANGKTYQTYQDKGRTIYLYDNSNATWVNGGVWYKVDGNGILSNDQLVRVANSF